MLESLRQLYARYGDTVADRIGALVFAALRIDTDVLSSAINRMGPLAGRSPLSPRRTIAR
jgi:esterase/lipase superfamily enzyme